MADKLTVFLLHQRILGHYRVMKAACAALDLDKAIVAQGFMDHDLDVLCRRLRAGHAEHPA